MGILSADMDDQIRPSMIDTLKSCGFIVSSEAGNATHRVTTLRLPRTRQWRVGGSEVWVDVIYNHYQTPQESIEFQTLDDTGFMVSSGIYQSSLLEAARAFAIRCNVEVKDILGTDII